MWDETEEIFTWIAVVFVTYSLFSTVFQLYKKCKGNSTAMLEKLSQQRLNDFYPEPLVCARNSNNENSDEDKKIDTYTVDAMDESSIDFTKVNYLNMLNNKHMKNIAVNCILKYGVGTCGPRGFFGTTEGHLELESKLSTFLGMEEAIIYAYGFAAPSNCVLAYCKKQDVIFCDEKINFALEQGILAAKSILIYFKHNNVKDFRQKLEDVTMADSPISNKRKFLVIEGIYVKTGTICPLPELIAVAKTYKVRVFIDEALSFGILGEKGRGVTEYFSVPICEVDMIIGSFEGAIGSIGSFCASSKMIIEHQRLSSVGYVFSASLPTYQAQAAITALKIIENSQLELFHLQLLSRKVHKMLNSSLHYKVVSDPISPYKVFNYKTSDKRWHYEREICSYCRKNGVYLIADDQGLVMNLNVTLYYQKTRLLNAFAVLKAAAGSIKCN